MINNILEYLDELFLNPRCELNYNKDYELLIAIVLSAQTTDKMVNRVTDVLFKKYNSLLELKNILIMNNWSIYTAISVIILFLFHYPCSTTCLTIRKETNSWFYTFLSMIIPTIIGIVLCLVVNAFAILVNL